MLRASSILFMGCLSLMAGTPPQLLCDTERNVPGIVAWYDPGTGDLTLAGSGISQLNDRTGLGHALTNGVAANQPIYDTTNTLNGRSVAWFNGTSMFLKTVNFTLNQPEWIVAVLKQPTWTASDHIIDGASANSMALYQYSSTPNIRMYAGTLGPLTNGLALNTFACVQALFSGAASSIEVNNNAQVTGDSGAGNAGGFTLGDIASTGNEANIIVAETLILARSPTATERAYVARLMDRKFNLGF